MKRKTFKVILITLVLTTSLLPVFFSKAEVVELRDLIVNAAVYNGKKVTVEAEVLDVLFQKKGTWINIYDKTASIGIWVEKNVTCPEITHAASYKVKGDIIRIKGKFNSSCKRHFGQTDIHAQKIVIVQPGRALKERVTPTKKGYALIWLCIFLGVLIIYAIGKLIGKNK